MEMSQTKLHANFVVKLFSQYIVYGKFSTILILQIKSLCIFKMHIIQKSRIGVQRAHLFQNQKY